MQEKKCAKCKIIMKPEDMLRDKQQKDGIKPYCRGCMRKMSSNLYYSNKKYRDGKKERYHKLKNKPDFKNRVYARNYVKNRIRNGRIKIGVCKICKTRENLEVHHTHGYEKENWGKFIWLCRDHHNLIHHPIIC
jgi:hypothetical protein